MKAIGVFALALTVACAAPALAQGRGHGNGEHGNGDHGNGHGNAHAQKGQEEHGNGHAAARAEMSGRDRAEMSGRNRAEVNERGRAQVYTRNGYVVSTRSGRRHGGAPAFCRNGAGHPVYGRSWCLQKGFGLGNTNWNRATWSDVILQPRRATIADVLSSVILGRLTNYAAQRLGLTSPLYGSWLTNSTDRRVYIVRSGSVPVAEMVDTNGDGRADYVLLHSR